MYKLKIDNMKKYKFGDVIDEKDEDRFLKMYPYAIEEVKEPKKDAPKKEKKSAEVDDNEQDCG